MTVVEDEPDRGEGHSHSQLSNSWDRLSMQIFEYFHIESNKFVVVVRFLASLTEPGTELWDVVREFASEDKHDVG